MNKQKLKQQITKKITELVEPDKRYINKVAKLLSSQKKPDAK